MRKLSVFNSVSLDGFFTDRNGDMSFAHQDPGDEEWNAFVSGNAKGGGALVFGRVTYQMMASFWPTQMAAQMMPAVAEGMNRCSKVVFSRTMAKADWTNTTIVNTDAVDAMRAMKGSQGDDMVILGSGSIVAQLTQHGLIDHYQFVVVPKVLGKGRSMFDGVAGNVSLTLLSARTFRNGNVLLTYDRNR